MDLCVDNLEQSDKLLKSNILAGFVNYANNIYFLLNKNIYHIKYQILKMKFVSMNKFSQQLIPIMCCQGQVLLYFILDVR